MNDQVTDVNVKPTAIQVMQLAQNVQALSALYLFIRAAKSHTTAPTVQAKLIDQHGLQLFINSDLLIPALVGEFDRLGQQLEGNGVSTKELFQKLDEQLLTMYPNAPQQQSN